MTSSHDLDNNFCVDVRGCTAVTFGEVLAVAAVAAESPRVTGSLAGAGCLAGSVLGCIDCVVAVALTLGEVLAVAAVSTESPSITGGLARADILAVAIL